MNDILLARQPTHIGVITHTMLKRGADLIQIRDNQDYLGQADTFEEYLSPKDVRKDAKKCMKLVEFYILHHRLQAEDIHDIHHDRLLEAMKAIELQPARLQEFLDDCRELSWKDLINKVRGVRGRASMPLTLRNRLFRSISSTTQSPTGLGRLGERVANTPCISGPHGVRVCSRLLLALSCQYSTMRCEQCSISRRAGS